MNPLAIGIVMILGIIAPLWGVEPVRILLVPAPGRPGAGMEMLQQELGVELGRRVGDLPHLEFVLTEEEQQALLGEWERQQGDLFDEKSQVELGRLKGAEYRLTYTVNPGGANTTYTGSVAIYDLRVGTRETVYASARGMAEVAEELARKLNAALPPRGTITQSPRSQNALVRIDMGRNQGLQQGQRVVKREGRNILARLRLTTVYPDSAEAEIEYGKFRELRQGDKVYLLLEGDSRQPEGGGKPRPTTRPADSPPSPPRRSESTRTTGELVVNAVPEGELLVKSGGAQWRSLGKSSRRYELAEGTYFIKVRSPGYKTHEEKRYIRGGTESHLSVSLKEITDMVLIPAGTFTMGAEGESDNVPHAVTLNAFYLDKKEVTVREYQQQVGSYRPFMQNYPADQAAIGISWREAKNYCESIGKRLPTEAEWERACRGPQNLKCGYGDRYDPNMTDARTPDTKIALFPLSGNSANGFGLFDMTGGVWEWCADAYRKDLESLGSRNPRYESQGPEHVLRGGAWVMQNPARRATCVYRYHDSPPDPRTAPIGFRCAADVD